MKISSLMNPRIKNVVKLKNARCRKEQGLALIDGVAEVRRAVAAGVVFKEVYVCRDWLRDENLLPEVSRPGIAVYDVSKDVFEKIAFGERKEGVVAVCASPAARWPKPKSQGAPVFMVLEQVEKPGNLGAVLRTCDGAGVDGVFVCGSLSEVFNPNCIRASLGAVFSLAVMPAANEDVFNFLRGVPVKIVAASPAGNEVYSRVDMTGGVALVLGSEHNGLSDFWMERADCLVNIPMLGQVDSLNVSVSGAVLLYEVLRQRQFKKEGAA